MDIDEVEANKNTQKDEQAWSIKNLLYGKKENFFFAGPTRGEIRAGKIGPSCPLA